VPAGVKNKDHWRALCLECFDKAGDLEARKFPVNPTKEEAAEVQAFHEGVCNEFIGKREAGEPGFSPDCLDHKFPVRADGGESINPDAMRRVLANAKRQADKSADPEVAELKKKVTELDGGIKGLERVLQHSQESEQDKDRIIAELSQKVAEPDALLNEIRAARGRSRRSTPQRGQGTAAILEDCQRIKMEAEAFYPTDPKRQLDYIMAARAYQYDKRPPPVPAPVQVVSDEDWS
jgi:hypothetical protein